MKSRRSITFCTLWLLLAHSTSALHLQSAEPVGAAQPTAKVDFLRDVAPILERHCIRCHQPELRRGEISLASAEDLLGLGYVVEQDPAGSYLLELITSADGKRPAMPKEGQSLSAEEVATVRKWIAAGAHWPAEVILKPKAKADASWWAFQPLSEVEPPLVSEAPANWQQQPIDRFLYASLQQAGLQPNEPAARRDLIRRATYDLTGLPPTPEEQAEFLADESPAAYEKLLDRLLASPRYGERWGRHWLDVVRFGESNGFERNVTIDNLWPFRDYVIRSLNDDKPFDLLVREHLAGDVLARQGQGDTTELEIASAFLVSGPYDDVGNKDKVQAAQIRANTLDEMIRTSSEAFLGLTLGCARCHDHKFDPLLQSDYYAWYASFAGVRHGSREVASAAERERYRQEFEPRQARVTELIALKEKLEAELRARAEAAAVSVAKQWTRPAPNRQLTEDKFAPVLVKFVRLTVQSTDEDANSADGYRIDEFEIWSDEAQPRNVALASAGAKAEGASRDSGTFTEEYEAPVAINGQYGARWLAAGPTLLITLPREERISRITFSSDRQKELDRDQKTMFVGEYFIEVSLDGKQWNLVTGSADRLPVSPQHRTARLLRVATVDPKNQDLQKALAHLESQLEQARRERAAVKPLPVWWVGMRDPAPGPFHIFLGGDPQRRGQEILPGSLNVMQQRFAGYQLPANSDEGDRRLALAEWMVDARNPLTPRVLANRLWQYHFGTGIVDTPSDFGYMGGRPTHPELLDWLAQQVQVHRWHLKPLHKLIMLSQAYQQSAVFRSEAAAVDADSRRLWRFPPRRLSAEEVRDTLLLAAGKLKLEMGGPGFRLYQYLQDNVATYVPLDKHGPETYRRAVYHQNTRANPVDLLADFDSPDCAFATPRRSTTTTPMQALTMLNHQFTLDMAGFLAERLQQEAGADSAAQINLAYQLLYGRTPQPAELQACQELLKEHGLRAVCRVLLNTSELVYLD